MTESAKKSRDEQIDAANKACEGIKQEIIDSTPGISDEVQIQTGEIMSWYSKAWSSISGFFTGLAGKMKEAREDAIATKQGLNGNGYNKINGHKYNGLSYVPFDGYVARLHKGERVLTAEENKGLVQNNANSGEVNQTLNFYGKVESPYEVAKVNKKAMRDLQFA